MHFFSATLIHILGVVVLVKNISWKIGVNLCSLEQLFELNIHILEGFWCLKHLMGNVGTYSIQGKKPGRVTSTYETYYNMYLNVLTKMGFITFIEKLKIQSSALLLVCNITFIVHENHW